MLRPGRVETPDGPSGEGAPDAAPDAATTLSMSNLMDFSSPTGGKLTAELSVRPLPGLGASLRQLSLGGNKSSLTNTMFF